jgi:hypothetical protein
MMTNGNGPVPGGIYSVVSNSGLKRLEPVEIISTFSFMSFGISGFTSAKHEPEKTTTETSNNR